MLWWTNNFILTQMNISSQIFSTNTSKSSHFFPNGTNVETEFHMFSVVCIICSLFSFPINSYVIWLIVRGSGNGLAAEFFILGLSVNEMLLSVQSLWIFLTINFQASWTVVAFFDGFAVTGHPRFQCLICVERYLAVVHPVSFLKFKPLRYKLICCAVSWVATFASAGFLTVISLFSSKMYFPYVVASLLFFISIQLFCCVAVLRALKQSGPGERPREREEENNMKRRAFYLIVISAVTTLIIHMPYIILSFFSTTEIYMSIAQFCFISAGLVQPVLFLCRVRKLNLACYHLPCSCNYCK